MSPRRARPRSRPASASPAKKQRASPRGTTAREIAAGVVEAVMSGKEFAGPCLDAALSQSRLDDRDRAFCTELAFGTLRWAGPLEASLLRGADKPGRGLDKRLRPHLLVAAYQLQHLDERVPAHAAVSEAMKTVAKVRPGLRGFSNALLRKLGSPLHALLTSTASLDQIAKAYGVPIWVAENVVDELDRLQWQEAIAALNARPPLSIAVLKPEEEANVTSAINDGIEDEARRFRPHAFVRGVFEANGAGAPERFVGFSDGQFVVQDPGSRLVAQLAQPQRGAAVVDLCAAPGTKTIGLAVSAGIRGMVTAVDVDARRLAFVEEGVARAARGGAKVGIVCEDARTFCQQEEQQNAFDLVLLDAPCSALGTTRRHPEVCQRRTEADVAANNGLQWELLCGALQLVKPGGSVVYAVCSPLAAEGREHLERVLQDRGDEFSVISAAEVIEGLPATAVDSLGALRLRTHLHQADGFYAFRLQRRASDSALNH